MSNKGEKSPVHVQSQVAATPETMSTTGDVEHSGQRNTVSLWQHLNADVNSKETTFPLAMYCFMTGYTYVTA